MAKPKQGASVCVIITSTTQLENPDPNVRPPAISTVCGKPRMLKYTFALTPETLGLQASVDICEEHFHEIKAHIDERNVVETCINGTS